MRSVLLVLLALFLVLLNGFFVAAEFAIVKVRATRIDELAAKNRFGARKARDVVRHLDAYLSATQLGITLASLGLGYIGEPAFADLIQPLFGHLDPAKQHLVAFALAFTIITALHIVVGELAPKSLAIQRSESTTLAIVYPLDLFYKVFKLPIVLLNWVASLVLKPFGLEPAGEHGGDAHSEEELRLILDASHAGGEIKESERDLVNRVLDFAHRQAHDVMVPRPDVVFLNTERTLAETVARAEEANFTRYPLMQGEPDVVVGMIHIKDLLALATREAKEALPPPIGDDEEKLRRLARPMLRVPETKPIDQLLRDFQRERQHMALVVDEYGGTAGIVTLEDIVEEIVGDIQDEFDPTLPEMERLGEREFRVDARMSLDKLNRALDIPAPEDSAEIDTIGGFVMATQNGNGRVGDTVAYGPALFTVTATEGRRIRTVTIRIAAPEAVSSETASSRTANSEKRGRTESN